MAVISVLEHREAPYIKTRLKQYRSTLAGFYLGFIVWGRSSEWPKATIFLGGSGGKPPRKLFEMIMRWGAIWCILRHNFENVSVCKDLVAFGWSLQYSYLYTVMITIFLGGKLGILGRGSFYPSNTLDRTLTYGDFAREKHTCVRRELQRRPALVWRSSCSYFRLSVCYSK